MSLWAEIKKKVFIFDIEFLRLSVFQFVIYILGCAYKVVQTKIILAFISLISQKSHHFFQILCWMFQRIRNGGFSYSKTKGFGVHPSIFLSPFTTIKIVKYFSKVLRSRHFCLLKCCVGAWSLTVLIQSLWYHAQWNSISHQSLWYCKF